MTRMEKHAQKKPLFWKAYFIYLIVIALAFIGIFLYVRGTMIEYERNNPKNYVLWLAKEASEESQLGQYLEKYNFSDNRYGNGESRKENFYNTLKSSELTVEQSSSYTSSNPAFLIKANDRPFMDIAISEESNTTKLGIMTLSDWHIDYCLLRNGYYDESVAMNDDYTLSYSITIPDNFELYIDNEKADIKPVKQENLSDFEYIYPFASAPKANIYQLDGLYYEPFFTAINNGGEEVDFEMQADGNLVLAIEYSPSPKDDQLLAQVGDPLEIGKLWSKFMTDDVGGPYHGRQKVIDGCKILKGTNLYDLALKWSTNVDITFVSGHTLDSFSNERVDNFIYYNQELLSCDVYFEKNMTLARGLGQRKDVFSNRMFFGKVNGEWYLLDMITLQN